MQSGIFWGYVGLIDGLIARIEQEYGEPMTVVGTGGLARLFARGSERLGHIHPELTMLGLVELYAANRSRVRRDGGEVA
jgi:type III pantothenate kinase